MYGYSSGAAVAQGRQDIEQQKEETDLPLKLLVKLFFKRWPLLIWIVVTVGIGAVVGIVSASAIEDWYTTLDLPPWNPPNFLFGIVWPILYVMIGTSGYILFNSELSERLDGDVVQIVFLIQLALNYAWNPAFFLLESPLAGLLVILPMDVMVGYLIYTLWDNIRLVSYLLIPYLIWILYASTLNIYIFANN